MADSNPSFQTLDSNRQQGQQNPPNQTNPRPSFSTLPIPPPVSQSSQPIPTPSIQNPSRIPVPTPITFAPPPLADAATLAPSTPSFFPVSQVSPVPPPPLRNPKFQNPGAVQAPGSTTVPASVPVPLQPMMAFQVPPGGQPPNPAPRPPFTLMPNGSTVIPQGAEPIPGGVCMMSNTWRDEQRPSFINFISAFLTANSFRLNFVAIAPDFIFNCGGLSVAFIFVTNWDCSNTSSIFVRVKKLKIQFKNLYVVAVLTTTEQNDSFIRSYFKYEMEPGMPTFVPVRDVEMGFEKVVKIAHSLGVYKRQDVTTKLKSERKQAVQGMEVFLRVVTSIPGIDNHDANALVQAIGSIEAISKASREYVLENTDLSAEKVDVIFRFFRDPKFYLSPKIN